MNPRRCERPIPFDALVDYWVDHRNPDERSDVEEHLFGCDECSRALESIAALGEGVRLLAAQARVHGGLSPSLLDRMEREGRVIRRYRAAAGIRAIALSSKSNPASQVTPTAVQLG